MDKAKLEALLERVEAATGPMSSLEIEECIKISPWYSVAPSHDPLWNDFVRALQGSIDSALALVERVLPGWWLHGLGKSPLHGLWWCQLYSIEAQQAAESEDRDTSPLAILAAMLKALIARAS